MAYTPTRKLTLSSNPASIAATMPDGGQSGFVVPLHIEYGGDNWEGGASDIFSNAQSGGQDITFWSSDGLTQYAHSQPEIYTTTAGAQELLTRVLVPSLSSSVATDILMQYGDATCAAQWSDGSDIYKTTDDWGAFWTLEEASGDLLDQTTNNHDGTRTGTVQAAGQVGHGQAMEGTDIITCNTMPPCGASADWTVSAWVRPDITPADALYILIQGTTFGAANGMTIWLSEAPGKTLRAQVYDAAGTGLYSGNVSWPIVGGQNWHQYTVKFDASEKSITGYEDGALLGSGSVTNPALGAGTGTASGTIGNRPDLARTFIGTLDEISIANSLRSADWITTDYNATSANGTFWTVGDAEAIGGVVCRRPPLAYRMGPRLFHGVI